VCQEARMICLFCSLLSVIVTLVSAVHVSSLLGAMEGNSRLTFPLESWWEFHRSLCSEPNQNIVIITTIVLVGITVSVISFLFLKRSRQTVQESDFAQGPESQESAPQIGSKQRILRVKILLSIIFKNHGSSLGNLRKTLGRGAWENA
jgi:hypothetical protein